MFQTKLFLALALGLMLLAAGCVQGGPPSSSNPAPGPVGPDPSGPRPTEKPSPAPDVSAPGSASPAYPSPAPGGLIRPGIAFAPGTFGQASFDPSAPIELKTFRSAEEMSAFLSRYAQSPYLGGVYYGAYYGGIKRDIAAAEGAPPPVAMPAPASPDSGVSAGSAPSSAPGYSQTNNQVASVDEADLIKTDGEYIYTVSQGLVYVIRATPGADARVLSTLDLGEGFQPRELFVLGQHLAVMGDFSNADYFTQHDWRPRSGASFMRIYDLSDRAAPKMAQDYKFEGAYFRARLSGGYVYLVAQTLPNYRQPLPRVMAGEASRPIPADRIHHYTVPYQNPVLITIHALPLSKPSPDFESHALVVEQSENLYMSADNNLYLAYTEYVNEWQLQQQTLFSLMDQRANLTASDRLLIAKIKQTDDDVLTQGEKEQKIYALYASYLDLMAPGARQAIEDEATRQLKEKLKSLKHAEFTVVHKVHVEGGRITPGPSAHVPGHINNQFSLDEHQGTLRIATTLNPRWSSFVADIPPQEQQSSANLYTLDASLEPLDSEEGIAPGEQIYATRFIGERLYLVTYRQVDPFFVYDLSDPKSIKALGSLKVPGFSRYLHPYDDHTVIGIGQDATESGRTTGLKISLFDVSDVAHPRELAKYVPSGTYADSIALWEHRAFLFSKEKGLLVIPGYSPAVNCGPWDSWGCKPSRGYNGALVFRLSPDSIALRGLIDHSQASGEYGGPAVERSLYISDMLYTKSPRLLRVNALGDLHGVKEVWLNASSAEIPVY